MVRYGIGGLVTALLAAGCVDAPSPQEFEMQVKAATAEALSIPAQDVIGVTEIERSPAKITWRAATASGVFSCDADDRLSIPQCSASGA